MEEFTILEELYGVDLTLELASIYMYISFSGLQRVSICPCIVLFEVYEISIAKAGNL